MASDEAERLAACPWCGGPGNLIDCHDDLAPGWQVSCENEHCATRPFTTIEAEKSNAIAAWNRRRPAPPPARAELAGRLREARRQYREYGDAPFLELEDLLTEAANALEAKP